jgi:hypothetical protein
MEKEGYDVSYISNVDTHTDPKGLLRCKGWLSVGHDEYYSLDMYNHVKAARDAGVNLAFLTADTCIGLLSFTASSGKVANRVIRRMGHFGPRMEEWARKGAPEVLKLEQRPDQGVLVGAREVYPYTGGGDWVCVRDKHWLFAGTGMKNGDSIPGLVGWEWQGDPASLPGLEVVAQGDVKHDKKRVGTYAATIYPGPKDNVVFNAATIWWSDGLSAPPGYLHPFAYGAKPKGPDPRVQRITANLLARFRGS